jgi:hypothetical protein
MFNASDVKNTIMSMLQICTYNLSCRPFAHSAASGSENQHFFLGMSIQNAWKFLGNLGLRSPIVYQFGVQYAQIEAQESYHLFQLTQHLSMLFQLPQPAVHAVPTINIEASATLISPRNV